MSDTTNPPYARLEVDGLTVVFGGLTAVQDASFRVLPGQIVALIGPNGAGKTTVFNAICGLARPRAGTIRVDGHAAPARPAQLARHGVSRTLQGLGLFDGLSVLENVLVPLSGDRDRDAASRAQAQLSALQLEQHAGTDVAALSYPDRKRVALARALVTRPRLLLLDEPAGGLGEHDLPALAGTIRSVADAGCAVLLVEHHVDFVLGIADHVVVLDFGRVIASGAPEDVRADPLVEEAYLGVRAAS